MRRYWMRSGFTVNLRHFFVGSFGLYWLRIFFQSCSSPKWRKKGSDELKRSCKPPGRDRVKKHTLAPSAAVDTLLHASTVTMLSDWGLEC